MLLFAGQAGQAEDERGLVGEFPGRRQAQDRLAVHVGTGDAFELRADHGAVDAVLGEEELVL